MPHASKFDPRAALEDLRSSDKDRQNRAFQALLENTREAVKWAYDLWDDLLRTLKDGDNRQRSIAAQVLSSLAGAIPRNAW